MRSRTARRRAGPVLLCAALVLAAAPACSDDEPTPAEPPTTTAPGTTTTSAPATTLSPAEQDEADLRQLAEDWFEAFLLILRDGNDLTGAENYLTGQYLEDVRTRVDAHRSSGQSIQADPEDRTAHQTLDVEVNGDHAEVIECLVDGDRLLDANGTVVNDLIVAYRVRTAAVRTGAGWRFSEQAPLEREEGVDHCTGA